MYTLTVLLEHSQQSHEQAGNLLETGSLRIGYLPCLAPGGLNQFSMLPDLWDTSFSCLRVVQPSKVCVLRYLNLEEAKCVSSSAGWLKFPDSKRKVAAAAIAAGLETAPGA